MAGTKVIDKTRIDEMEAHYKEYGQPMIRVELNGHEDLVSPKALDQLIDIQRGRLENAVKYVALIQAQLDKLLAAKEAAK